MGKRLHETHWIAGSAPAIPTEIYAHPRGSYDPGMCIESGWSIHRHQTPVGTTSPKRTATIKGDIQILDKECGTEKLTRDC
jgi:hypothetical protein